MVHLQHGIARLSGLDRVEIEGEPVERVALAFAKDTELLADVNQLANIWRYGGDSEANRLDDIAGEAWAAKRSQIEAEIAATARELKAAAAARAGLRAPVIRETPEAAALAHRFAYLPSADQRAAINAVLKDLAAGTPMNGLVCGDVGFGKPRWR